MLLAKVFLSAVEYYRWLKTCYRSDSMCWMLLAKAFLSAVEYYLYLTRSNALLNLRRSPSCNTYSHLLPAIVVQLQARRRRAPPERGRSGSRSPCSREASRVEETGGWTIPRRLKWVGQNGAVTASGHQSVTMPNEPMHRHRLTMHRAGPNPICPPRIDHGLDVRSTAMLRGIPRQMTLAALKAYIDEACFGTYNYLCLRANFATGKNVGYAFVNFADCTVLLRVYMVMHGKPIAGWETTTASAVSGAMWTSSRNSDQYIYVLHGFRTRFEDQTKEMSPRASS